VHIKSSIADKAGKSYADVARDLARELSESGQRLKLEVTSRSMLPVLRPGDRIVVQNTGAESLGIGDLVIASRQGEFITHRLVGLGSKECYTKGDNARYLDPPVPFERILGKVIAIERENKIIDLQSSAWNLANRILGRYHRFAGAMFRLLHKVRNRLRSNR
jgi:signal peptidase I